MNQQEEKKVLEAQDTNIRKSYKRAKEKMMQEDILQRVKELLNKE